MRALFSNLRNEAAPTETIPRSRVALSGADALAKDDFVDAQVTVSGVTTPGVYRGQVELLPQGAPRAEAVTVQIELNALTRPVLTPIAPQDGVRGELTHCASTAT